MNNTDMALTVIVPRCVTNAFRHGPVAIERPGIYDMTWSMASAEERGDARLSVGPRTPHGEIRLHPLSHWGNNKG